MFCIELVNITFKQGTLGLNEIYLQFLDNVACISWGKLGNASKYFCATVEILRNCSPHRLILECKIREGSIIAAYHLFTCKKCQKFTCKGPDISLFPMIPCSSIWEQDYQDFCNPIIFVLHQCNIVEGFVVAFFFFFV